MYIGPSLLHIVEDRPIYTCRTEAQQAWFEMTYAMVHHIDKMLSRRYVQESVWSKQIKSWSDNPGQVIKVQRVPRLRVPTTEHDDVDAMLRRHGW